MAAGTSSADGSDAGSEGFRVEHDALGALAVPVGALWGIHAARAVASFPLAGRPVHPALVKAYGDVKLAALLVNRDLGFLSGAKADALERACREMAGGLLTEHVVVDVLQIGKTD